MGNHHAHGDNKGTDVTSNSNSVSPQGSTISRNGSARKLSRKLSSADLPEKEPSVLLPLDKLAKILSHKTHLEENASGIGLNTFTRYLFPRYPTLAANLYNYFNTKPAPGKNMSPSVFKQSCDKFFLAGLDDDNVRDMIVRMFGEMVPGSENCNVSTAAMRALLMCAYHISMDHYSEGPQMCLAINKTLTAVVDSCFHAKEWLSAQFVSHWLQANCPRLLVPVYRYAVHSLATSYRSLESDGPSLAVEISKDKVEIQQGLELTTPVLEQPPPFGNKPPHPHLLQMSLSWLLAGALPPMYSRPQKAHSPSNSGVGLSSAAFLTKLLCAVPSHWINLYDSDEMGLGCNRFLHHVLAYKGPTLCLLRVEGGAVFCIASPCEWRESHLYWGGEDSAVFQILPKFLLLEKGSKLLYLNPTVRGYPTGLRAGSDPRNPIISVDGGFDKMEFRKIPYNLLTIEVWGCGDQASRDVQMDIKKWQVKEAERQRDVKLSAADWLGHPDRYLLELAGRPQYNNQNLENCNSN